MAQMSSFIVGIIIVGLVAVCFGILMGNVSQNYSVSYSNSTLSEYNQLQGITSLTSQIQNTTTSVSATPGIINILDKFFIDAYSSVKLTANSFGFFNTIATRGLNDLGLPPVFRTVAITLVLIFIFIVCLLGYILKTQV